MDEQEKDPYFSGLKTLTVIYKGMETTRFHCFRTSRQQNIGEHSAGVALLYGFLAGPAATVRGYQAALSHDLAEAEFGDIPAPFKRASPPVMLETGETVSFRDYCSKLELDYVRRYGLAPAGALSSKDNFWLKLADNADGAIFAASEGKLGHKRLQDAAREFFNYMTEMRTNSEIQFLPDEMERIACLFDFVASQLTFRK